MLKLYSDKNSIKWDSKYIDQINNSDYNYDSYIYNILLNYVNRNSRNFIIITGLGQWQNALVLLGRHQPQR
jgi:hypothetical protein